jgi:hypothetical protein
MKVGWLPTLVRGPPTQMGVGQHTHPVDHIVLGASRRQGPGSPSGRSFAASRVGVRAMKSTRSVAPSGERTRAGRGGVKPSRCRRPGSYEWVPTSFKERRRQSWTTRRREEEDGCGNQYVYH